MKCFGRSVTHNLENAGFYKIRVRLSKIQINNGDYMRFLAIFYVFLQNFLKYCLDFIKSGNKRFLLFAKGFLSFAPVVPF